MALSRRTARFHPATRFRVDNPLLLADGTMALPFLMGVQGLGAPSYDLRTRVVPGSRTRVLEQASTRTKTVQFPVLVEGVSYGQMRERCDELAEELSPLRGPGLLELSADMGLPEGQVRVAPAAYVSGLDGDESQASAGQTWCRPTLVFEVLDYWTSLDPVRAQWRGLAGFPWFQSLPYRVSPYGFTNTVPFELPGSRHLDAWPSWTFRGPFTRVRVACPRTDQWLEVVRPTVAGEVVSVVTKPGEVAVTVATDYGTGEPDWAIAARGVPAWSFDGRATLSPGSEFFGLRVDDVPTVDGDGTTEQTAIGVEVWPQWFTAP